MQYFESLATLVRDLADFDKYGEDGLRKISKQMRRFNMKSLAVSVRRWEGVLEGILGSVKFAKFKQRDY